MKRILFFLLMLSAFRMSGQCVIGRWKAIDDESGKPVSIIEIFESRGRIYGRIVDILIPKDKNKLCVRCSGDDHNKPLMGLMVIKGLKKDGDEYTDGKVLDPKHGRLYSCTISCEGTDKLKLRGYIGISLIGRTQYWHRVK